MGTNKQAKEFLGNHDTMKCSTFMGIKVDESWEKKDLLMLINYLGGEICSRHAGWATAKFFRRSGAREGV